MLHDPATRRMIRNAAFLLAAIAVLPGCTTTKVKPTLETTPKERYRNVAIGEFTSKEARWEDRARFLRRGVVEKLREEAAFEQVIDPAPSEIPPNTIVVSGQLVSLDKGNAAARFIVGFGAGAAKATGTFQLKDDDGRELALFALKKTYAGGVGIGGGDYVTPDQLVEKLGEKAGEAVIEWSRGEGID